MSLAWWLNSAWMVSCQPESWAFRRAVDRVASTQAHLLRSLLRANRETVYGRRHGFANITSPREYQERAPLMPPEVYEDLIVRVASSTPYVLTRERVTLLQPTSGTTRGEKLIPYTATLRRQFQRAVATWMADLFRHRPALRDGRAYWSISPALSRPRRSRGGIRIGFDDDASYLGTLERLFLKRLLIVPPGVTAIRNRDEFRFTTLLALLMADDLALISVWNPTFLSALLARFEEWQDRLCAELQRLHPARAAVVRDILRSGSPGEKLRRLWPRLALISCWADGAALLGLPGVRELFPGVEVQPKGLLATEGVVSFPLIDQPAAVLAVRSHFFEFEELSGGLRLAHEVEVGGRYRVILTTGGGLYRYPLRDEVEIVGRFRQCPLLRFIGKADRVSDLVGEKLAEPHVRSVLARVFVKRRWSPRFALLVPVLRRPPRYVLYLQGPDDTDQTGLAQEVQEGLEANPHYRYAVEIGQLAAVEVRLVPASVEAARVYEAVCLERGQKLGDIKPAALDAWTGWPERLAGA